MRLPSIVCLVLLAACSDDSSSNGGNECGPNGACPIGFTCSAQNLCVPSPTPDARGGVDGSVSSRPDATTTSTPDARPAGTPDAGASLPDAAVSAPDARIATPDARVTTPDAAVPPPPPDAPGAVETQIDSKPTALTNDATATFTFSSPTAGATFACAVDAGAFAACTSPHDVTGLADGPHTFAVRASAHGVTDASPASASWTLDTTPPVVTLLGPSGGATTGIHVAFSFASEAGATLTCALDSAALAACPTGAAQFDIATAGAHTFEVVATDTAGNASPPAVNSFTVDTSVATVVITPATRDHTIETATIAYTASSPSSFFCKLDGGAFASCPAAGFSFTNAAAGSHTLTVHAVNSVGNTGPDASYTWSVDGPLTVIALDGNTPFDVQVITDGAPGSNAVGYSARTDANGVAALHVPEGGDVRFERQDVQIGLTTSFVMTDVHGYEAVRIGRPSRGASVTGTLARTLPAAPSGTTCVYDQIDTSIQGCLTFASPKSLNVTGGALDSTGKLNLLSVAAQSGGGTINILGYAWAPSITFVPGGTATAAAPAWLTPVPTTFTLSNLGDRTFLDTGLAVNGLVYAISGSAVQIAAGAGPVQVTTQLPPGIGRNVFQIRRISGTQNSQVIRTDANHFSDGDLLPLVQGFAFAPENRSVGITFQPPVSAKGIVTVLSWSEGQSSDHQAYIVTPPTLTAASFADLHIAGPSQGKVVQVTQVAIDVAAWSEADFQQGFMPLYGASGPGFPVTDVGAGNTVRISLATQSVTQTQN